MTNRRVNAIEHVVIPKIENTINFISSELDEQDREEFFRLKKVQGKKKARAEIEEAAKVKLKERTTFEAGAVAPAKSLLAEFEPDADVIF